LDSVGKPTAAAISAMGASRGEDDGEIIVCQHPTPIFRRSNSSKVG
jgi:hypothetical protein